mmetsp:Transcript_23463/g.41270  ORF Transcript_23463/g.41270 Transcript_23463/m.41270 type:complete len:120 (-) Transcript_23463:79-438(-)
MGLIQLLIDAWVGTTAYAVARRSGIFVRPKLEHIVNPRVRHFVRKYFEIGETSANHMETVGKAMDDGLKDLLTRGGQSQVPGRRGQPMKLPQVPPGLVRFKDQALDQVDNLVRRLRSRR